MSDVIDGGGFEDFSSSNSFNQTNSGGNKPKKNKKKANKKKANKKHTRSTKKKVNNKSIISPIRNLYDLDSYIMGNNLSKFDSNLYSIGNRKNIEKLSNNGEYTSHEISDYTNKYTSVHPAFTDLSYSDSPIKKRISLDSTPKTPKKLTPTEKLVILEKKEHDAKINKIKLTLSELTEQFDVSHFYGREMVQNSIDADSSRIDVTYNYDSEKKSSLISFTDNGHGMNYTVIRKKLLTLFDSTKEDDSKKVGRFGVGFISLYAQPDLENILVETSTGDQAHTITLYPESKEWDVTVAKKPLDMIKKGTSVNLNIKNSKEDFEALTKDMTDFLKESCSYIKVPLFVDGEKINTDFDIPDAVFKIPFGGDLDIEGMIALTPAKPQYSFYNRRILIQKENNYLFSDDKDISFIFSSSFLDYNIARKNIIKNDRFKKALMYLEEQKDNFLKHMANHIAKNTQYVFGDLGVTFVGEKLLFKKLENSFKEYEYAAQEVPMSFGKKISDLVKLVRVETAGITPASLCSYVPEYFRNEKMFTVAKWEDDAIQLTKVSLLEILAQGIKEKEILSGNIYESVSDTDEEVQVMKSGKMLIPSDKKSGDVQRSILKEFLPVANVYSKYRTTHFVDLKSLDSDKRTFVNNLNTLIQKSPLSKYVDHVYFDSELNYSKPYQFKSRNDVYLLNTYSTKKKKSLSDKMKNMVHDRRDLLLSMDNDFIKKSIDMVQDPEYEFMAYIPILSSLSYTLKIRSSSLPLKMKTFIENTYGAKLGVNSND